MKKLQGKKSAAPYQNGNYVFHGSANGTITVLEPRQSYSFNEPDGEPAISAASDLRPALFMALFSKGFGSSMGTYPTSSNPYGMVISKSAWDEAASKGTKGYVYVLYSKDFAPRSEGEWELRATHTVLPVAVIEIDRHDMPTGIIIKNDNEVMEYLNKFRKSVK